MVNQQQYLPVDTTGDGKVDTLLTAEPKTGQKEKATKDGKDKTAGLKVGEPNT